MDETFQAQIVFETQQLLTGDGLKGQLVVQTKGPWVEIGSLDWEGLKGNFEALIPGLPETLWDGDHYIYRWNLEWTANLPGDYTTGELLLQGKKWQDGQKVTIHSALIPGHEGWIGAEGWPLSSEPAIPLLGFVLGGVFILLFLGGLGMWWFRRRKSPSVGLQTEDQTSWKTLVIQALQNSGDPDSEWFRRVYKVSGRRSSLAPLVFSSKPHPHWRSLLARELEE